MGKFKKLMEVSSNVGSYGCDEGEPDTGFIRGDKKRTLGTLAGKPEPWFERGGYTQADFPKADYKCHIGLKSAIAGQGELKKAWRDPLFAINHTFAMLRANINRLIRRTWCSTKKIPCLEDHLALYAWVHNSKLQPAK